MIKYATIKIEKKDGSYKAEFGITHLPNRKMPCLFRMRGAMLETLAYFRSEEDATKFNNILEVLLSAFEEGDK